MKVILKKDIPSVGRIGELVSVKDGYARNFLIPRSMAIAASAGSARMLDHQKRLVEIHKKKIQKESQVALSALQGVQISMDRRANEGGKLFGSITPAEVSEALLAKGFTVDRKDIELPAIKAGGTYSVNVRLPGDVFGSITLKVTATEDASTKEAKAKGPKAKRGPRKSKAAEETAEGAETTETPDTDEKSE